MTKTYYTWDRLSDNVLMESSESSNTLASYSHEPGQYGQLLSQRRDGVTSHYHFDGVGNTRQLTDESQDVTDGYTFSAFGQEVARTGTTVNPWGYQGAVGYYANPDTEDLYVRARHYRPTIGRWLSVDPVWAFGFGLSPYMYSDNSPVILTALSWQVAVPNAAQQGGNSQGPFDIPDDVGDVPALPPTGKPESSGPPPLPGGVKARCERRARREIQRNLDILNAMALHSRRNPRALCSIPVPTCRNCNDDFLASVFPARINGTLAIKMDICHNNRSSFDYAASIRHEMVHALDICLGAIHPNTRQFNCRSLACTEIRAVGFSGQCEVGGDLRGNFTSLKECAADYVRTVLDRNRVCRYQNSNDLVFNAVWDACNVCTLCYKNGVSCPAYDPFTKWGHVSKPFHK